MSPRARASRQARPRVKRTTYETQAIMCRYAARLGHSAWPRCSTGRVERTDGHQDARITGQRTLV